MVEMLDDSRFRVAGTTADCCVLPEPYATAKGDGLTGIDTTNYDAYPLI